MKNINETENRMAEMSDIEVADTRLSSPSLAQVKAVVEFIQKHPTLAQKGLRHGVSYEKVKKLWAELSNIVNSIKGAVKSTKGWIKFWSDKRRNILLKQKQIKSGKIVGKLTFLEKKILDISCKEKAKTKKSAKQELCNGDEDLIKNSFDHDENGIDFKDAVRPHPTEADERHLNIMEKMIEAMDQQAAALMQMAQATVSNSKAMDRLADASHKQALAVDRLAGAFETINTSVYDVRNVVVSIDYTMKRCLTSNSTLQRQNTHIFN